MRKICCSSNASCRMWLSSFALGRSRPKGFSSTTRPRRFSPTDASWLTMSGKALGGMAR